MNIESDYKRREASIADEIERVIRWATSSHLLQYRRNANSGTIDQLRADLYGALFTAHNVRLLTFFEGRRCINSLKEFIRLARVENRIDSAKERDLLGRVENLMKKDDFTYLKSLRNKVTAHWDTDIPTRRKPVFIDQFVREIIAIFFEAGGRNIDEDGLNKDVLTGWKDLLNGAKKVHMPSASL